MKYLDIRGKSVMTSGGRLLGIVDDLIVDFDSSTVQGILMSNRNILKSRSYMPTKHLKLCGNNVLARAVTGSVKHSFMRKCRRMAMRYHMNREVADGNGKMIGRLSDLVFDCNTGQIQAIEVSKGFFEDIFEGRRIIISQNRVRMRGSRLVISESGDGDRSNDVVRSARLFINEGLIRKPMKK